MTEFFEKYRKIVPDRGGDGRGVFGTYSKESFVDYELFLEDIESATPGFVFLEYSYLPEAPYSWQTKPKLVKMSGVCKDNGPCVFRRSFGSERLSRLYKSDDDRDLLFSILYYEFEIFLFFFDGIDFPALQSKGIDLGTQYTKDMIDAQLSEFRK